MSGRRLDEFGRIPDRYPVKELEYGGYWKRTLQNVKDSDGTILFYRDQLTGGTEQTFQFCTELKKPSQLIEASAHSIDAAAALTRDSVREYKIDNLNVAGPRQSDWAEGHDYTFRVLDTFLASL